MEQNIGKFLKDLRVRNGYTQKELADILIVTPQTISKWELNNSTPSLDMLLEISNLYGVSTDEIIKCEFTKRVKEDNYTGTKSIMLYANFIFMFIMGIMMNFIDFVKIHSRYLEHGLLDISTHELDFSDFTVIKVDNVFILALGIVIPILLFTLYLIDKRKVIMTGLLAVTIALFLTYLLPILYSPALVGLEFGMVLYIVYVLLLIISMIVLLSDMGIEFYQIINKYALEVTMSAVMILLALFQPKTFIDFYHYYFSESEYLLLFLMLITPGIVLFKSNKNFSKIINVYIVLFMSALLWMPLVYLFNSGLIFATFHIYIYLLFLAILYKDQINLGAKSFKLLPMSLYVVEVLSIVVYLYLFINIGDLFFDDLGSIRIYNTIFDYFIVLNFLILLFAMVFRYIGMKQISMFFYFVWTAWLVYFTSGLINEYFFNDTYTVTDGILFLVPPFMLALYYLSYVLYRVKLAVKHQDMMYLISTKGE